MEHELPAEPLWQQIAPLLDAAMATLKESDRQAVLLRYFENRSLAEVGNASLRPASWLLEPPSAPLAPWVPAQPLSPETFSLRSPVPPS